MTTFTPSPSQNKHTMKPDSKQALSAFIVLLLINILNYADRAVLPAVLPKLQTDLGINDFQAGLLGSSFLFIYAIATLPLGALADKRTRKNIVAACVGVWSVATALAGMAQNFTQIFLLRSVLGIGEAGYAPASLSMIGDYFPKEQRGRVLSLWSIGNLIGTALGMILGGLVAVHFGWRWAFYLVGVPGLITAFLIWRAHEPRRGAFEDGEEEEEESIEVIHGSIGSDFWGSLKKICQNSHLLGTHNSLYIQLLYYWQRPILDHDVLCESIPPPIATGNHDFGCRITHWQPGRYAAGRICSGLSAKAHATGAFARGNICLSSRIAAHIYRAQYAHTCPIYCLLFTRHHLPEPVSWAIKRRYSRYYSPCHASNRTWDNTLACASARGCRFPTHRRGTGGRLHTRYGLAYNRTHLSVDFGAHLFMGIALGCSGYAGNAGANSYQERMKEKEKATYSHRWSYLIGAGYGIRTRGLNFGKVTCYHYTKPAYMGNRDNYSWCLPKSQALFLRTGNILRWQ